MKRAKKISIAVLILIFFTLVNIFVIRGSYTLTVYNKVPDENPVTMDKDGIVEVDMITYDESRDCTNIRFKAISQGTVNVSVHRDLSYLEGDINGYESSDYDAEIIVDKFFLVYEKGFFGSLTNMNIIRFEIIFLLVLMMVNIIISTRKLQAESPYSYRIMYNIGALIILGLNLLVWSFDAFISEYEGSDKLYGIYGDIVSAVMTFAIIIFPFVLLLAVFLIFSNVALIRHEGKSLTNMLGILLGVGLVAVTVFSYFSFVIFGRFINVNSYGGFHVAYFVEGTLFTTISYLECMMIGTYICSARAQKYVPRFDKDYIIILGCSIRKDGTVTPLLRGRADRAIWFAKKQKEETGKDIVFVASGGQGADEVTSEAEAIKNYLLENGIDEDHIIVENKSTTTLENMKFSYEKICEDVKTRGGEKAGDDISDVKIAFSTTGYHVFRSGHIAYSQGIKAIGIGNKTKWYFHTNALIREFVANMNIEKKRHIEKLLVLILIFTALLLVSYQFKIM